MHNLLRGISKKAGLPPGTLVSTVEHRTEPVQITLMNYDEAQWIKKEFAIVDEIDTVQPSSGITWLDVAGIHDIEWIERIGTRYEIHSLILEDILNTTHRSKYEDHEDFLFVVLKSLAYNEETDETHVDHVCLIIGSQFVISFRERTSDLFDPVRKRIETANGRVRKMSADYLAYTLIDTVVDGYFVVLEKVARKIEAIEEELIRDPQIETLQAIHQTKNSLMFMGRMIWPMRETANALFKSDSSLLQASMEMFVRDIYDHVIQAIETLETMREMVSGMHDLYLSTISNKMNEVMKVLTLVATLFIPLSFVAGVYGMNFKYIPELEWHWGYFAFWGVVFTLTGMMLIFFKKKRWL